MVGLLVVLELVIRYLAAMLMCFVVKTCNLNIVAGIASRPKPYNLHCRTRLQTACKRVSHF
jgi:hypothetical protein